MSERLAPQVEVAATESRWFSAAASAGVGLLFLIIGLTAVRFTPEHPKATDVFYALDTDTARAMWASPGVTPDAWSRGFVTNEPDRTALPHFFPPFFTDQPDAGLLTHEAHAAAIPPH